MVLKPPFDRPHHRFRARELQTDLRIDRFFWGTGTVLMGTHDRAIDQNVFKVGIIAQRLEKILPNAAATPPVEALARDFLGQKGAIAAAMWLHRGKIATNPARKRPVRPPRRLSDQALRQDTPVRA